MFKRKCSVVEGCGVEEVGSQPMGLNVCCFVKREGEGGVRTRRANGRRTGVGRGKVEGGWG